MDITQQTPSTPGPVRRTIEKTCENPECAKTYTAGHKNSRYCSDRCRWQVWDATNNRSKRNNVQQPQSGQQLSMMPPVGKEPAEKIFTPSISKSGSFSADASFIIDELKRSRELLQKNYDSEREARKKIQNEKIELEKELAKLKHDHEIEKIRDAKPSGLQGLSENPLVNKLVDQVGPGLNAFLMALANRGAAASTGMDGQLEDKGIKEIITWYTQLPENIRNQVYALLDTLADIKTPEMLLQTLTRIQNLLKNGAHTTQLPTSTGAFYN